MTANTALVSGTCATALRAFSSAAKRNDRRRKRTVSGAGVPLLGAISDSPSGAHGLGDLAAAAGRGLSLEEGGRHVLSLSNQVSGQITQLAR